MVISLPSSVSSHAERGKKSHNYTQLEIKLGHAKNTQIKFNHTNILRQIFKKPEVLSLVRLKEPSHSTEEKPFCRKRCKNFRIALNKSASLLPWRFFTQFLALSKSIFIRMAIVKFPSGSVLI